MISLSFHPLPIEEIVRERERERSREKEREKKCISLELVERSLIVRLNINISCGSDSANAISDHWRRNENPLRTREWIFCSTNEWMNEWMWWMEMRRHQSAKFIEWQYALGSYEYPKWDNVNFIVTMRLQLLSSSLKFHSATSQRFMICTSIGHIQKENINNYSVASGRHSAVIRLQCQYANWRLFFSVVSCA